jgi:hypothetical protein
MRTILTIVVCFFVVSCSTRENDELKINLNKEKSAIVRLNKNNVLIMANINDDVFLLLYQNKKEILSLKIDREERFKITSIMPINEKKRIFIEDENGDGIPDRKLVIENGNATSVELFFSGTFVPAIIKNKQWYIDSIPVIYKDGYWVKNNLF